MIELQNKHILFVSPVFFGYERAISNALESKGAHVCFVDDRPSNNFWLKGIIRFKKKVLARSIDHYYKKVWSQIAEKHFDYFLALSTEAMPLWFAEKVNSANPHIKRIYYQWDSFRNKKYTTEYLNLFDSIYSFDVNDCKAYPQVKFRPLFYIDEYRKVSDKHSYKYDFCFIGTGHTDRFVVVDKIKRIASTFGKTGFWYLYLQNRAQFWYLKIANKNTKMEMSDFKYKPLSKQDTVTAISQSKIIIDIQHPKQTGLTIRCIEALGASRKIITTNQTITDYDFYTPQNILVIDRNAPDIPLAFIEKDFKPLDSTIIYKYSLNGWIDEIFC